MIRPFKLILAGGKYYFKDHRENLLINEPVKRDNDFFNKLFSYPITAFVYDIQFNNDKQYINPKFDRHDVIRALDFWIEYWVYQNKCDYILEGTVNKDFELTVRELIETREAVLKLPADTKFVRKKIRTHQGDDKQFNWLHGSGKWYYRYQNGRVDTNMRKTEITKYSKKYGIEFPKPLFQPTVDQIIEFTDNVVDSSNNNTTVSTVDQFCYVVRKMTYKEYMNQKGREVRDDIFDAMNLAVLPFSAEATTITVQDDDDEEEPEAIGISGEERLTARILGIAARDIKAGEDVGDGWFSIRTVREGGMIEAVQEGLFLYPGGTTASSTEESDTITYDNMTSIYNDQPIMVDSNLFTTIPIIFSGNGTDISMDIFMESGSMIDQITSWNDHRIQIRPSLHSNFLEIDGQKYHTTNISISHNPIRPLSMIFRDLWVQSLESTAASRGTSLRLDFTAHGTNLLIRIDISITLFNPRGSEELLRTPIDQHRAWNLEILGDNRVRIGGDGSSSNNEYRVLEPIHISFGR